MKQDCFREKISRKSERMSLLKATVTAQSRNWQFRLRTKLNVLFQTKHSALYHTELPTARFLSLASTDQLCLYLSCL